ncbi:hypothetical protein [Verrucosispora sp. NA02020]|uniref:hypothetical protein n=1 Tax=unclassified Micromonospora TaxID=2617518 RepID=UPI00159155C8|nr:hypothetical protein [Verrucosispora sp. NA02020]QKW15831.1 hypothetical protein HUT12_25795 [Verrucosispora sp. NA02020]
MSPPARSPTPVADRLRGRQGRDADRPCLLAPSVRTARMPAGVVAADLDASR